MNVTTLTHLVHDLGLLGLVVFGFYGALALAASVALRAGLYTLQFRKATRFFRSLCGRLALGVLTALSTTAMWYSSLTRLLSSDPFLSGLPFAVLSLLLMAYLVFWLGDFSGGGHRVRVPVRQVRTLAIPNLVPIAIPE